MPDSDESVTWYANKYRTTWQWENSGLIKACRSLKKAFSTCARSWLNAANRTSTWGVNSKDPVLSRLQSCAHFRFSQITYVWISLAEPNGILSSTTLSPRQLMWYQLMGPIRQWVYKVSQLRRRTIGVIFTRQRTLPSFSRTKQTKLHSSCLNPVQGNQ